MASVEAKCDGGSVLSTHPAVRAQDEEFGIKQARWVPSHAGVLRESEEISRGLSQQHLRGDRQRSFGTSRVRLRLAKQRGFTLEHLLCGNWIFCVGRKHLVIESMGEWYCQVLALRGGRAETLRSIRARAT